MSLNYMNLYKCNVKRIENACGNFKKQSLESKKILHLMSVKFVTKNPYIIKYFFKKIYLNVHTLWETLSDNGNIEFDKIITKYFPIHKEKIKQELFWMTSLNLQTFCIYNELLEHKNANDFLLLTKESLEFVYRWENEWTFFTENNYKNTMKNGEL